MGLSYKLLIHIGLLERIHAFLDRLPDSEKKSVEKQVITAFNKLASDPVGQQNRTFHENRNPALVGLVRKIYVGGNDGYRLMNLVLPEKKRILPFFMSEVKRSKFDYNKVDWSRMAKEVHHDFISGNPNAFKEWAGR